MRKEFRVAALEASDRFDDTIEFTLPTEVLIEVEEPDGTSTTEKRIIEDDYEYVMSRPDPSQMTLFIASFATDTPSQDTAGGLFDFLRGTLGSPDQFQHLRARLNDRHDPLGLPRLMEVLKEILKDFSGFPTQPLSESSSSPTPTGKRSTGRVPGKGSTLSAT